METRKGTPLQIRTRPPQRFSNFQFLFSIFLLLSGCGAPGDPVPPAPPVPAAISDLAAHQAGDGVQLAFTLPTVSVSGDKLAALPAVEILRGNLKSDGSPDVKSFRAVYTIPGALVDNYRSGSHTVFRDPIAPAETKAHPGADIAYLVRTRASQKRASADSNVVSVHLFSVPEPISPLEARVTESAIELTWPAPTRTSAGDPLPAVDGYRIYRTEVEPASATPPPGAPSAGKAETNPALLDSSQTNGYNDKSFVFDHTYTYMVRSVIQAGGTALESSDSQSLTVTPRDTFPPAAPQNLVAVSPQCAPPGGPYADLSWAINLETDLAGYRVYRSEQEGTRDQPIELLWLVPSYRDTSVQSGRTYWYSVTALDRAGNESPASASVAVPVPSEQCKE
jgi:fibronectin type 3 domain-containing protein